MKNKHLRLLIILGTLVLTGLFVVQVYWFRRAFDAQEKQFDHTIQIALMRVADSVSAQPEVRQLSSNFFFVATESDFDNEAIDSLLQFEFLKRNLSLEYELGVYNADDDTLVYGQYIAATRKHLFDQEPSIMSSGSAKNFAVYFPKKESYVIAQLDIWIFSTLALLLMMCFFAWAIATLLRERKFSELKNDFINNMTHEFKTPVTNIGITGEIIRKKLSDAGETNVYVDILLRENDKLKKKIDTVLLGASLDHQRTRSLERFDIHQLITECAEAFQLKVNERNGALQLDLTAKDSYVLGDRELLAQAINNVIDNAEKYSLAQPFIVLKTVDSMRSIEIQIADRGMGIPQSFKSKVFEKFFRVQRGDVHNVKGFGLGLSFVKGVVRAHRGKVRLLSELNQGTEITIILPKA